MSTEKRLPKAEQRQKYLRMIGGFQAITDRQQGATNEELQQVRRDFQVGAGIITALRDLFTDVVPNGTTRFKWKESNRQMTYSQMLDRALKLRAERAKESVARVKAKKKALEGEAPTTRKAVWDPEERQRVQGSRERAPELPLQVQRADVIRGLEHRLQKAIDAVQLEAKGVAAVREALEKQEARFREAEQEVKHIRRAIGLVKELEGGADGQ